MSYKAALLAPARELSPAPPQQQQQQRAKWEPVFVLTKVPYLKRDRLYGRQPDEPPDEQVTTRPNPPTLF